jgi:Holliday junction resolvase RusA-like endonuclease
MKNLKTTIPIDIMNQIADLTEKELKEKGIFYLRNETQFSVYKPDIDNLLKAQEKANLILLSKGILTTEMLLNDVKNNFGN